jgi:hypothetical protein
MRRLRRWVLEIWQSEVSLSMGSRRSASDHPSGPDVPGPAACAVCGSPWVLAFMGGAGSARWGGAASPQHLIEQLVAHGLHGLVGDDGQLWLCRRSLQELADRANQ